MTQLKVTIEDSEVRTLLDRAALAVDRMPAAVIRPEMETAKRTASGGYPGGGFRGYDVPPPSGTKYRRTGTYGRSFRVTAGANNQYSKSYTLTSNARRDGRSYTSFVGGMANGVGQASVHRGRWPLIRDAVAAAISRIQQKAREYFARVLGSGPGGL